MDEENIKSRARKMTRGQQEKRLAELNEKLGITSPQGIAGGKTPPTQNLEELLERDFLKELLGYPRPNDA